MKIYYFRRSGFSCIVYRPTLVSTNRWCAVVITAVKLRLHVFGQWIPTAAAYDARVNCRTNQETFHDKNFLRDKTIKTTSILL